MYTRFLRKSIFIFCALAAVWLPEICAAQSEEEMKFLRMFYEKKDLVVSSTRHPKSISQVAENISVITSDEIEAMNAHTVAEVLNRIPGPHRKM